MQYYPIYLNITNKRCMVIGGGAIGERKARGLIACGARVTVVSRSLTPFLLGKHREAAIEYIQGDYHRGQLDGMFLVIGATDKKGLNRRIARDARALGILANTVDDPAGSDFILPALLQRGDLQIAVSTGGQSPAFAKKLRDRLGSLIGPEYARRVAVIGDLRKGAIAGKPGAEDKKKLHDSILAADVVTGAVTGTGQLISCCLTDPADLPPAGGVSRTRHGQ